MAKKKHQFANGRLIDSMTSNFMDSLNQHLPNGLLLLLQPVNQSEFTGAPEMINLSCLGSACSSERNSFHVSFTCDTPILMLIAYVSYVPSFVCWFYAEGC